MGFEHTGLRGLTKQDLEKERQENFIKKLEGLDLEDIPIFSLKENIDLQLEKGITMSQIQEKQKNEKINIFSFINAVKYMLPIVRYAYVVEQGAEERAKIIQEKMQEASRFATSMMLSLSLDEGHRDLAWVKSSFERFYSEAVLQELKEQKQARVNLERVNALVSLEEMKTVGAKIIEIVKEKIEKDDFVDFKYLPLEDLKMSFLSKMTTVMVETSLKLRGQIYIEEKVFLEKYYDFLIKKATFFFAERISPNSLASHQVRFNFFASIVNDLSSLYVEFYKDEILGLNMKAKGAGLTLNQYLARMPNVIDCEKIENRVVMQYRNVFDLVKVILPKRK